MALQIERSDAFHDPDRFTRADDAYRAQLERFVANSAGAMAMLDRDMRYLAFSRRWVEDFHLDDSLRGRSHYEVFPDVPERWREVHRRCLDGGVEHCDEDCFRRRDGSCEWLRWQVSPWLDATDHIGGIVISSESLDAEKRNEAAIASLRETARRLVEDSPFGIFAIDAELRVVQVSEGASRPMDLIRASLGDDFGAIVRSLWPEPFGSWLLGRFRHTLETGEPFRSTDANQRPPEGSDIEPYDWRLNRVTLPDGRAGVVCHYYNHTERRRYEVALRQNEERYRTLVETTRDGIVTTDMTGRIEHANTAYQRMVGYTLDELRELNYRELTPERWHEFEESLIRDEILPHGDSGEYEKEYIRKDGTVFPVSLRVWIVRDIDGRPTGMSGIVRDITERKRAEHVMAQLAAIVESSDDAVVSKDLSGIVRTWNDGAQRLFGYGADEMIGRPIRRIIPPERLDEEDNILRRIAAGESIKHFDTERLHKDGHRVPVSLTISPIKDAQGRIVGASKVARDISERKLAEDALHRADRQKDEFLAMLAHELRNPLAPIRIATNLIERTAEPDSPLTGPLAILQRQTAQLTRLVDDLLDISRIAQGRIELRREALEIGSVIEAAVETVQPLVREKGHRLVVASSGEPLYVDGDRTRLVQSLGNVLHNAAKYTDPGGRIEVRVTADQHSVTLETRDNGSGIPTELLPHVFELFVQNERTLDRAEGGLGIGLSVVRRLIEMHGGTVAATSAGVGRGSTFTLRLPRGHTPETIAVEPELVRATGRRVLVVDDNADAADSLALLLQLDGHDVEVAYGALSALAAVERTRPEVVLLDIGLPHMDGYEVARKLRAGEGGAALKLVALTGYGQQDERDRAREAGFDAHLVKPADPDELARLLSGDDDAA